MIKTLFLIGILLSSFSFASESSINNMVIIGDKSGLSKDQVRKKAQATDAKYLWSKLSPKADKYDWIQTTSGEWFKGSIKTLYRDRLEFKSKAIGLHTFKLNRIKQIKSYHIIAVNIDKVAIFEGIIRYKDKKIAIIQGDKKYIFPKNKIVSFAPEGKNEYNKWSSKISVSFDTRSGNTNQVDYTASANIKRITSKSRLTLDYLGRYSQKNGENTTSDNRINEKFDIYVTRHFFWTPLFSELYQDRFKNIDMQATAGFGLGYILIDNKTLEWDISGGPAYIYTLYSSVENDASKSSSSAALELSTVLNYKITRKMQLLYNYKLTLTNQQAGIYKHHMVTTLENRITAWLSFNITYIWDFILSPEKDSNGNIPKSNDNQIVFGLGVRF